MTNEEARNAMHNIDNCGYRIRRMGCFYFVEDKEAFFFLCSAYYHSLVDDVASKYTGPVRVPQEYPVVASFTVTAETGGTFVHTKFEPADELFHSLSAALMKDTKGLTVNPSNLSVPDTQDEVIVAQVDEILDKGEVPKTDLLTAAPALVRFFGIELSLMTEQQQP